MKRDRCAVVVVVVDDEHEAVVVAPRISQTQVVGELSAMESEPRDKHVFCDAFCQNAVSHGPGLKILIDL